MVEIERTVILNPKDALEARLRLNVLTSFRTRWPGLKIPILTSPGDWCFILVDTQGCLGFARLQSLGL